VGNAGAGRWAGIITGDRCSGTWQATRSELRHCERSEAIQKASSKTGLLRRYAPRNDGAPLTAAPGPSPPGGLRSERPARPWRSRRRRP
jgi:hypothetical protein